MRKNKMEGYKLKLVYSKKRKKTIQAKLMDDQIFIYLPGDISKEDEKEWIKKMLSRIEKQQKQQELNTDTELFERAQYLNNKYFNGELVFEIKYVVNQKSKFGSCNPNTKTIRMSHHVAKMPRWVQDYMILHEMAHLLHPNHGKEFWKLVNRYRYTERAKGFLIAIGRERDD
jgi:predicted metal-dependent hydrolase